MKTERKAELHPEGLEDRNLTRNSEVPLNGFLVLYNQFVFCKDRPGSSEKGGNVVRWAAGWREKVREESALREGSGREDAMRCC